MGATTAGRRPSILVVEDEWITACDIQQTLAALGYRVTALAPSVDAALAAIDKEPPDLALVDVRLQGARDGIELAGIIRRRWSFPVVYLTAHSDRETLDRLKVTRPYGFVGKPFDEAQLRVAVELALHNAADSRRRQGESERQASSLEARAASLEERLRRVARALAESPAGDSAEGASIPDGVRVIVDSFSRREREILRLLLSNRRVPAIARQLSVSVFTVRNHLRSIFRKAGVHSQEELIRLMEGVSLS